MKERETALRWEKKWHPPWRLRQMPHNNQTTKCSRTHAPPAGPTCKIERILPEREGVSLTLAKRVENAIPISRSLVADPVEGGANSRRNWVKATVRTIACPKHLSKNAARWKGVIDNSTVAPASFTAALSTPGLFPSTKGGDDRFSLAPSAPSSLRPHLSKAGRFLHCRTSRLQQTRRKSI